MKPLLSRRNGFQLWADRLYRFSYSDYVIILVCTTKVEDTNGALFVQCTGYIRILQMGRSSAHLEKDYLQFFSEKRRFVARRLRQSTRLREKSFGKCITFGQSFVNEYSDVELIAPDRSIAFSARRIYRVESYMKLIALRFYARLPYVRLNFVGLPLLLGIGGDYEGFGEMSAMALMRSGSGRRIFRKWMKIGMRMNFSASLRDDVKELLFGEDGTGRAGTDIRAKMSAQRKVPGREIVSVNSQVTIRAKRIRAIKSTGTRNGRS